MALSLATSGLIGAGLGLAGNLFNGIFGNITQAQVARENMQMQRDINQQNIDLQRETNAQNERLMREGWARDDTAYQRKAADLTSAGLSKTLAAGGSAMSSQAVKLQAPQNSSSPRNDYRYQPVDFNVMNQLQMAQEFTNKQRENAYIASQTAKNKEETRSKKLVNDLNDEFLNDMKDKIMRDYENGAIDNQYKNKWLHDLTMFKDKTLRRWSEADANFQGVYHFSDDNPFNYANSF